MPSPSPKVEQKKPDPYATLSVDYESHSYFACFFVK